MTLHNDTELFSELITATSLMLGIPEVYIEKDYWVCVILRALSELDEEIKDKVVFKGGTSLSKAHKLIERFSEDIDLAVVADGLSSNQKKVLIRSIEKKLLGDMFTELTEHPQSSKGSSFRKTVQQYPQHKTGNFGDAVDVIILELNTFANPTPNVLISVNSYIYDFLIEEHAEDLITKHDLYPFEINVLALERTFCEKISAIARASFEGIPELQKKIRHLYDIYLLMQRPQIEQFLYSSDFDVMMEVVRQDDLGNSQFNPQWAKNPIKEAPIFQSTAKSISEVSSYYENVFNSLVHGVLPPIESVQEVVELIVKRIKDSDQ